MLPHFTPSQWWDKLSAGNVIHTMLAGFTLSWWWDTLYDGWIYAVHVTGLTWCWLDLHSPDNGIHQLHSHCMKHAPSHTHAHTHTLISGKWDWKKDFWKEKGFHVRSERTNRGRMMDRNGELVPNSCNLVRERVLTTGLSADGWYSKRSGVCRRAELPGRSVKVKKF